MKRRFRSSALLPLILAACTSGGGASRIEGTVIRDDGLTLIRRVATGTAARSALVASCAAGEIALSGGCSCDGSDNAITSIQRVGESWSCSCDQAAANGNVHRAAVLCTPSASVTRTEAQASIPSVGSAVELGCSEGQTLSASAHCATSLTGTLDQWVPFSVAGVRARCSRLGGGFGQVKASCLSGLIDLTRAQELITVPAGEAASVQLSCGVGPNLLGGGCLCPEGGALTVAYPSSDLTTMSCSCFNPTASAALATVYVRCLQ